MSRIKVIYILGLACIAMALKIFIGSSPSVLSADLQVSLGITAATLGAIGGAVMLGSAAMQIPVGLLTDRLGPRPVLVVMLTIMGACTILFSLSPNAQVAAASRFFTGIGYGFTVPLMVLLGIIFSPQTFARANSVLNMFTGVGTMLAMGPLQAAATVWGWRACMGATGVFILVFTVVVYFSLPNKKAEVQSASTQKFSLKEIFKTIITSKTFWLCGLWYAFVSGAVSTLTQLWWHPYLTQGCGMEPQSAANILTIWPVISMFTLPLMAWLSEVVLKSRKKVLVGTNAIAIVGLILIMNLSGNPNPVTHFFVSLPFYLFVGAGIPVMFAILNESFPPAMRGTAMALASLLVMVSIAFTQTAFGYVLDISRATHSGVAGPAFTDAMLLLLGMLIFALLCSFMLKESFKKAE